MRKYGAKIKIKGGGSSTPTYVEVFANDSPSARRVIIAQYGGGDKNKITFTTSPQQIK